MTTVLILVLGYTIENPYTPVEDLPLVRGECEFQVNWPFCDYVSNDLTC